MSCLGISALRNLARNVIRDFKVSPDSVVEIVMARMKGDWDYVDELIAKAFLNEIERFVEIHEHFNEGKHYCINIKVHSLDLSDEQVSLLLDSGMELLRYFQEAYISPWMDYRYDLDKPDVFVKGKSGGWLCLDRTVLEKDYVEAYDAKNIYEEVKEFREEWDALFEEMKQELNKVVQSSSLMSEALGKTDKKRN